MGRPVSFRHQGIDCKFPTDPDALDKVVDPQVPSRLLFPIPRGFTVRADYLMKFGI